MKGLLKWVYSRWVGRDGSCTRLGRPQGIAPTAGFEYTLLKLVGLLTILLALLPALAMATPSPDETDLARQSPTVRVDPAESIVRAGQTFTVSVMIDDVSDLGGFEFTLLFITTTVTVDSVAVGDFPGSTGRMTIPIGPIIDNQAGRASFATATVGNVPGSSGTGALATIALTAQGSGESPLDLQDVVVLDTKAQHQTTTVEDGMVRVGFAVYLPLILKD